MKTYEALFSTYYKLLCAYAYFLLKDQEEAKDLVQGLFMELWEKKRVEELEGDVKAYLYRSVHNRCLNHIRNHNLRLQRKVELTQTMDEVEEEVSGLEEVYEVMEKRIKELPIQRQEAINMVYLQNKKYIHAANEMGISINSLKTHLKMGLRSLREKIKKDKKGLT